MPVDQAFHHSQFASHTAHLVFEKQTQGFAQFKIHLLGKTAYIVVALDDRPGNGKRLDDIGVYRPLCQPLHVFYLMGFFIEDIDKAFAYNLTLTLGFFHTGQFAIKFFFGIDPDNIQAEMLVVVHDILELVFPQQTVIDKNTSKIFTNGLVQQNSRYRRIDPP